MPLLLKICGITTLEDARFCAGAGADFLGFIQYPDSPRYVAPEQARAIIEWVYGPQTVGVFVDETAETINQVVDAVGFDLVQLHGDEPPEVCKQVDRPVIKAFGVSADDTPDTLRRRLDAYRDVVAYVLLDTRTPQHGGSGRTFNWDLARSLSASFPLFLAGGLNAANIADAVRTIEPLGVDLSSSLESTPGTKDFDKLTAFFETFDALRAATTDEQAT